MAARRLVHIRRLIEVDRGRGLEIGPLYDPIVRRGEADISYVDVYPGDKLRAEYGSHPGVPIEDIVEPDYYLIHDDGARSLPDAVEGAQFDWVVASHVIEHVPDVIGWLDEVAQLLFDDGRLVLAIPDRRFSFDALRPATTVGQMLLAHRARDVTPSVRAVYDHYSQAVTFNPAAAWLGLPPDPNQRIHDLDYVLAQLARCEDGQYVDCHVWLFTPRSFIEQLQELERLDLVSFVVDEIVLPRQGEFEFYVRLRRISRELDGPEREAMRRAGMRTWIEGRRFDERIDSSDTFSETATAGLSRSELKLIRFKRRAAGKSRRVAHGVLARLPGRS